MKNQTTLLAKSTIMLLSIAMLFAVYTTAFAGNSIERISLDTNGSEGNGNSQYAALSLDGRYVVFESIANNLVAGDTNNQSDIFVYDRANDTIERVSVDSNGVQGNASSYGARISDSGRYIGFAGYSSTLVVGDTNNKSDVFVRDRDNNTTVRVSVDSNGSQGNDNSFIGNISADGRYVVFNSSATNLVAGDTNGVSDVFVHDRNTGATTRVSVDSNAAQANAASFGGDISDDGRYVAFISGANNLVAGDTNNQYDAFVHDRNTGATTRVSVDSNGGEANSYPNNVSISGNGRYVVFASYATNLVANDMNGDSDVFVHDRNTGATTRVSVDSNGSEVSGWSDTIDMGAGVSTDGRYIMFISDATNLVANDTNGEDDIFLHDRTTGQTTRVSAGDNEGNNDAVSGNMSSDAAYFVFSSDASNMVTGDTNGSRDVFFVAAGDTGNQGRPTMGRLGSRNLSVLMVQRTNQQRAIRGAEQMPCLNAVGSCIIANLQTYLMAEGFNPGPIDGLMGPRTQAALDAWQVARS